MIITTTTARTITTTTTITAGITAVKVRFFFTDRAAFAARRDKKSGSPQATALLHIVLRPA